MQPFVAKQKVEKRRTRRKASTVAVYRSYINDIHVQVMNSIGSIAIRRPSYKPARQLAWFNSLVDQIAGLTKCLFYRDLPLLFASTGLLLFLLISAFANTYDPFYIGGRRPISLPLPSVNIIQPVASNFVATNSRAKFQAMQVQPYIVEAGDTISGIAYQFQLRMDTLISYNDIDNVRRLRAGHELLVPNRDGLLHIVQAGESLESIASRYSIAINAILDANNLVDTAIAPQQKLFIPDAVLSSRDLKIAIGEYFLSPTTGRLTSGFGLRSSPFTGERQFHYALDIANASGTPIRAVRAGTVSYVGYRESSYGYFVIIRHDREFQTLYAHLQKKPSVAIGTQVNAGDVVGLMGNTGRSTGNHLHFSIIRNGKFVNPLQYIDH